MKSTLNTIILCITILCISAIIGHAGSLDPPAGPIQPTMKSLGAMEPSTTITSLPFTIVTSGYYTLCSDLTGQDGSHGIEILASDVTVDLRGFTLIGGPDTLCGIYCEGGATDISIRNGRMRDWNGCGIDASEATKLTITEVVSCGNGSSGIAIQSGIIDRCSADSNGGSGIVCGGTSVISNSRAQNNGQDGINGGSFTVVHHSSCVGNGEDGIDIFQRGNVSHCDTSANGGAGIKLQYAGVVKNCTADFNSDGILLAGPGGGCLVVENECSNNSGAGVNVLSDVNRVERNHLIANEFGYYLFGVGNFTAGNTCFSNAFNNPSIPGNHTAAFIVNPGQDFTTTQPWANFR